MNTFVKYIKFRIYYFIVYLQDIDDKYEKFLTGFIVFLYTCTILFIVLSFIIQLLNNLNIINYTL